MKFIKIFILISIILLSFNNINAIIPKEKYGAKFEIDVGLTHKIIYGEIKNLQDLDDILTIKLKINESNFNLLEVKNSKLSILKNNLQKNIIVDDYDNILYNKKYNNLVNYNNTHLKDISLNNTITYISKFNLDSWNLETNMIYYYIYEKIGSHIETITYSDYIKQNSILKTKNKLFFENKYENIYIQRKDLLQDTIKYKYEFYTPIIKTSSGWGNFGTVYLDINDNIFFDKGNSSWWNINKEFRSLLPNSSVCNSGISYSANDNRTINDSVYWVPCTANGEPIYIYYNKVNDIWTDIAFANETTQYPHENASTLTGNNPTLVYPSSFKLVLHFDDGLNANDSSQSDSDGNAVNTPTITIGKLGDALSFDGSTEYIEMDSSIATIASNDEGSVAFWYNRSSIGNTDMMYSVSDKSEETDDVTILFNADNTIGIEVRPSAGTLLVAKIGADTSTNTWHHLAFTMDSNGLNIYRNGVNQTVTFTTGDVTTQAWYNDISDLDAWRIGARVDAGGPEFHYPGLLDEVMDINRSLTLDEVRQIYWNGIGNFSSLDIEESLSLDDSPNITQLLPSNNTIVILNGTIFDQEFNLTATDDINLTNATLHIWNKTTENIFNYFVKEFVDNIENIDGNFFTGNIDSLKTRFDGDALIIDENSGANPLDFIFNFSNIDDRYNNYNVHILADYTGSPTHDVNVSIFNYTVNSYINLFSIPQLGIGVELFSKQLNTNDIVNGGNASIRIHHIQNGNPSHILFLGHLALNSENVTKKFILDLQNNTNIGVIVGLPEGIYLWNYEAFDNSSQSSMFANNYTFTVNADITPPNIIFNGLTPANNSNITTNNTIINVTSNEILVDIILTLNGNNFTMNRLTAFNFYINLTDLVNGTRYFYNVTGNDSSGNNNISETRNFLVQEVIITPPPVTPTPPIIISDTTDIREIEEIDTSDLFYLILLLFIIFFMFWIAINKNSAIISIVNGFVIIISTAVIKITIFTFKTRKFIPVVNNINTSIGNISLYNNTIFKFTTIHTFVVPDRYIIILLIIGVYTIMRGSVLREDVEEG